MSRRWNVQVASLPSRAPREKRVVRTRSEEAFRRHYDQVFRYLRRRLPSDDEAEELTQVVFTDAAQRLEGFKPGTTPVLAWLYTVAQRRLADRARRLARNPSLRALDEARMEVVGAQEYGADVAAALRAALAGLPEQQRRVVVMKLVQGLPFSEIAKRIGSTEAACKMRFARGLESVRDELESGGFEP